MPLLSSSDMGDEAVAECKQASGTASACSTLATVLLLFLLVFSQGKGNVFFRMVA